MKTCLYHRSYRSTNRFMLRVLMTILEVRVNMRYLHLLECFYLDLVEKMSENQKLVFSENERLAKYLKTLADIM